MDLNLDPSLAEGYQSRSQIARVITEHWARENLFCPACPSEHLDPLRPNARVRDFDCPDCKSSYQLKSADKTFGRKASNSAYWPKMKAIQDGQAPNYIFLRYSSQRWMVMDLFIIPGYFITPAIVEKRPPLGPHTRRPGWVGSNILLSALPGDARVSVVANEEVLPSQDVRDAWSRFAFLGQGENAKGGWTADVLMCVRKMREMTNSDEFVLQDFYKAFEGYLGGLHPENRNVQPKIRQQLQILRDNGVLEFLNGGHYKVLR